MCTSITARQHAGLQNGGAFIILTRSGGDEKGGEREVRIRGVGQSKLGSRLGCWARVDGADKVLQDKEIFMGVKLHDGRSLTITKMKKTLIGNQTKLLQRWFQRYIILHWLPSTMHLLYILFPYNYYLSILICVWSDFYCSKHFWMKHLHVGEELNVFWKTEKKILNWITQESQIWA